MFLVILLLPGPEFGAGIRDRFKPMGLQALLPYPGIEGLNMGIVRRRGWSRKD